MLLPAINSQQDIPEQGRHPCYWLPSEDAVTYAVGSFGLGGGTGTYILGIQVNIVGGWHLASAGLKHWQWWVPLWKVRLAGCLQSWGCAEPWAAPPLTGRVDGAGEVFRWGWFGLLAAGTLASLASLQCRHHDGPKGWCFWLSLGLFGVVCFSTARC